MQVFCVCYWQMDYYYEYTECDSTGSRWRVAIPQSPGACTGLPEPVRGTECSKYMCVCLISGLEFPPLRPDWLYLDTPQPTTAQRHGPIISCWFPSPAASFMLHILVINRTVRLVHLHSCCFRTDPVIQGPV